MNGRIINALFGEQRKEQIFRAASLLFFLSLWFWKGAVLLRDSGGFIDGRIIRSPLYPLIINIFSFLDDSLKLLVLFQLLLGLFAVHHLLITLKKIFNFGYITSVILFLFLTLPYYFITLNQKLLIGNSVMSGAVCYPLFLLAIWAVFRAIIHKQMRYYIYFILISTLLVLTRRQFLFLYPFFIILWLSLFLQKGITDFSKWHLIIIFILSIITADLLERTYQYVKFNEFSNTPFTGRQVLVLPMFVAEKDDVGLFEDQQQRDIFRYVYREMADKEITFRDKGFNFLNLYRTYEQHYNQISHHVIPPAAEEVLGEQYTEHRMDDATVQISLTLIKHHFMNFIKLYLKNIEVNIGNKSIASFLVLLFILGLIYYIKTRSELALIILLSLILQFGNYMLIAAAEPIIWRYTFYTNQIFYSVLALAAVYGPGKQNTAEKGVSNDEESSML